MNSHDRLLKSIRQAEEIIQQTKTTNTNISGLINHMYSELAEYDSWQEKFNNGTEKEKISAAYWLTQGQGKNIELGFDNYLQSILTEL